MGEQAGDNILHRCCERGRRGPAHELPRLIAAKCDVNKRNARGFFPLIIACEMDDLTKIKLLIAAGADVDMRNSCSGASSLALACEMGHERAAALLVKAKADVCAARYSHKWSHSDT